jgi:hypothetical protein
MTRPPEQIDCVECGGVAHLNSYLPDDEPLEDGYPIAYTCEDCNHRHDVIWVEDDEDRTVL